MTPDSDGQLPLDMTGTPPTPEVYLLLTNREGLLEALSSGFVKPGPLPKGNRHLSDLTRNGIPLLSVPPWEELIRTVTTISANSFPVVITFPKSAIKRGDAYLDSHGTALPDDRGALIVVKGGGVPVSAASGFYVAEPSHLKRVSAPFGSFRRETLTGQLHVDADLFAGEAFDTDNILSAIRAADDLLEHLTAEDLTRADALAGGLQLLAGLSEQEGLSAAPLVTALRATLSGHTVPETVPGTDLLGIAVKAAEPHGTPEAVMRWLETDPTGECKLMAVSADILARISPDEQDDLALYAEIANAFRTKYAGLPGVDTQTAQGLELLERLLNSLANFDSIHPQLTPVTTALWHVLRNPDPADLHKVLQHEPNALTRQVAAFLGGLRAKRPLIAVDLRPSPPVEELIDTYVIWNLNRPYHGAARRDASVRITEAGLLVGNILVPGFGSTTSAPLTADSPSPASADPDIPPAEETLTARRRVTEDADLALRMALAAQWDDCIVTTFTTSPDTVIYTVPKGKGTVWNFSGAIRPRYHLNTERWQSRLEATPDTELEGWVSRLVADANEKPTRLKSANKRRGSKG